MSVITRIVDFTNGSLTSFTTTKNESWYKHIFGSRAKYSPVLRQRKVKVNPEESFLYSPYCVIGAPKKLSRTTSHSPKLEGQRWLCVRLIIEKGCSNEEMLFAHIESVIDGNMSFDEKMAELGALAYLVSEGISDVGDNTFHTYLTQKHLLHGLNIRNLVHRLSFHAKACKSIPQGRTDHFLCLFSRLLYPGQLNIGGAYALLKTLDRMEIAKLFRSQHLDQMQMVAKAIIQGKIKVTTIELDPRLENIIHLI